MAALLVRAVFHKQLGLVRQGIFGTSSRWIQHSSGDASDDYKSGDEGSVGHDTDESTPKKDEESHHDEHESPFPDEHDEHEADIRRDILDAALVHVPELGWSSEAIEAGAQAVGLSAMAEGMFIRGGGDLVLHFQEDCNVRFADYLVEQSSVKKDPEASVESPVRKSSRVVIRDALEMRLRMLTPYIDQWPQAMGLMLLPQNAPDSVKCVAYMVDEIWYHAGDTSTDINWYTKRGVLAGLYGSTELFMVRDNSPDFEDTWSFLDRRMSDIGMLLSAKTTFEKAGSDAAELLSAAVTTVRNMSGLNSRNR